MSAPEWPLAHDPPRPIGGGLGYVVDFDPGLYGPFPTREDAEEWARTLPPRDPPPPGPYGPVGPLSCRYSDCRTTVIHHHPSYPPAVTRTWRTRPILRPALLPGARPAGFRGDGAHPTTSACAGWHDFREACPERPAP